MKQESKELNSIIVWILILSIIRSIIRLFTAIIATQIYSDTFVIIEIILSIFVIAASIGILFKNKYALIALFVLGTCISLNAFFSGNSDIGFTQLGIMGLWALTFCLKKNGQSAWKTILFDNKKDDFQNVESETHIESAPTETPLQTSTKEETETIQDNSIVESNNDDSNQMEAIESMINEVNNKELEKTSRAFNNNTKNKDQHNRFSSKMWIGVIVCILVLIISSLSYWAWNKFYKTQEEKFREAKVLFKANQTEEAIQILEDLADNDYVRAKTALGNIYLIQKSVPINPQKGFHYLEEAAQTDTNAIHLLVRIYGGKKCKGEKFSDDIKLRKYAEMAIEKKCCLGEAYFELGNIYARQERYSNAFYYWQKSTEYGESSAHRNIGILFYNGWGGEVNYSKAKFHLEKALKDNPNDPLITLYMGKMYKYGNGVPQNIVLALEFLKKAADKGNEIAQREYAEIEMSN